MGHKKPRISPQQSQKTSKTPPDLDSGGGNISSSDLSSLYAPVKIELSPAIKALQQGEYTKALRLLKNLCLKYENPFQSALVCRVEGAIYLNLADSAADVPNLRQQHLKNAVQNGRSAVRLSPSSVEFSYFYVLALSRMAKECKDHEEVVGECERILAIENPIDPADDCFLQEYQFSNNETEARIAFLRNELRQAHRFSNIKSISSWMKNLGNGDKFQVIPIRMNQGDGELKLYQERRRNGKPTKMPEERKMEIEARVAVARPLQHKSGSPHLVNDVNGSNKNGKELIAGPGSVQKPGERRKSGNVLDAGVHHPKHVNKKRGKKNKREKNHKNKDLKASNIDESVKDILLLDACADQCPASENSVAGSDHGALQLQEEVHKSRTEFEAEERKLVEVSENQRQSENLGKAKHSTEQRIDTLDGGWMAARHPRRNTQNRYIWSENEDNGGETLTRSQGGPKKAESQGPGTFQGPQEPPFISTSLRPLVVLTEMSDSSVSCDGVKTNVTKVNSCGRGLKNEFGQYNCFLNVIIQSLWHIQRFRDEFFLWGSSKYEHVCDQCPACALFDIFNALRMSPSDNRREAVDPSSLLVALVNKYPDTKFFQEGQMNDASEVLGLILDCLHQLFTPAPVTESVDAKCNCLSHSIFGMDIVQEMNCSYCLLVSTYEKTSYVHYITASSLRIKKVEFPEKSFGELLYLVQREDNQVCDPQNFGCGKPNYMSFVLSTAPHVFTAVLSWQNGWESLEVIKATLAALSTDIDIGALCNGLRPQKRHCLVSVVCFIGVHYKCFAYSHEQWIICDDETVKVIGRWSDVLKMCEEERLQPTILFFEAVNK